MINILYLIDPSSIHDLKWMSYFSEHDEFQVYFICRHLHYNEVVIEKLQKKQKCIFLGSISDFSIIRFYNSFKEAYFLKNIIKRYQINIFHIQYAEPNILYSLFRWYFKIPIITTCRGTDVLKTIPEHFNRKNPLDFIVSIAYKSAFKLSDWLTVTSISQQNSIQRFAGKMERISIIRTGVDLKIINQDTSEYFSKKISRKFILFPRYIRKIYNHEFCISSLALLPQEIKRNYEMVFIGKDSGDLFYQKHIEDLMLIHKDINFVFLEKQNQNSIFELYKQSELIIMTPTSDGSPVSAMESIALNRPIILGPIEYDSVVFTSSTSAVKLHSWNKYELSDLIQKVLFNKPQPMGLDTGILEKIDREYNMKKLMDLYLNLLK